MSAEKTTREKISKYPPVDCSNDEMMVAEGIRVPILVRNPEWSKKTGPEKKALKRLKKIKGLRASAPGRTVRIAKHRITVHLKNLKKVPNFVTTYSAEIYPDEIRNYMNTFFDNMKEEVKIVYYNGKQISYYA